jgi:hypothetical protein
MPNQRIIGGFLFTMLDDGKRHEKELAKIHDLCYALQRRCSDSGGGKIQLSDIVVGSA